MYKIIPTAAVLISGITLTAATLVTGAQAGPGAGRTQPLPAPTIRTAAELPRFGEGVVFDAAGRLFVSDPFDNAVLQLAADGTHTVWARLSMPNGHKVLADGTHVVLEQGAGSAAVAHLAADGTVLRRITADEQGRPLRFPNDLTIDRRNGGLYFTDPGPFMGGESGRIFYVGPDWSIRTVSDGEVAFPNGIVLRPDGRTLLVAESLRNRVVQFRVRQAGVLGAPRVFTDLPSQPNPWTGGEAEPDGMALDEDGRLYVAHFGAGVVRVVDRTGRVLGSYGSASSSITNLAFGGPQRDELYLYAARGDSLEEFGEGGRIVVLTLPGTRGAPLLP